MSTAAKILPYYTYEDYLHWEGRWELIDGIPYAMSPLPVPKHHRIVANLIRSFGNELTQYENCRVYAPLDYRVLDDTVLQPDVLIVCGEIEKKYLDFPPALVVEILSPCTALKDRHTKFSIYEGQGIRYYLIISQDTEEVEVYEIERGAYVLRQKAHAFRHEFTFDNCPVTVDFNQIWE
jgi:Uma2 family endonuclease